MENKKLAKPEKTIDRIIAYAISISNPSKVILFGSMASGTHNLHSDLDLLIVVDNHIPTRQISLKVGSYARQFSLSTDVMVCTQSQVERAGEKPDSFLASILKVGQVRYEKK